MDVELANFLVWLFILLIVLSLMFLGEVWAGIFLLVGFTLGMVAEYLLERW